MHTHTCLVTVEPTTGTAACGVSNIKLAGICPAAANNLHTIDQFLRNKMQ